MGLIFKEEEPLFFLAVHIYWDDNGTSVDFIGLIQVTEESLGFEFFGSQGSHIHERWGLSLTGVDFFSSLLIGLIGLLNRAVKTAFVDGYLG